MTKLEKENKILREIVDSCYKCITESQEILKARKVVGLSFQEACESALKHNKKYSTLNGMYIIQSKHGKIDIDHITREMLEYTYFVV